jgi:TonB family protein
MTDPGGHAVTYNSGAIEASNMSESWKELEGHTVDGRFRLESWLGGSDHSAVFLTLVSDSRKAAIKLTPADPTGAEKQLLLWKMTREVTHPNLIRIFATGRCELDGADMLYQAMEYAEENLGQIIPERALTAEEARAMLPPVLRALQSVHDKRYVHGHIQPSNILAIGDQVKLSSDGLSVASPKSRGGRTLSAYDPPEAATGVALMSGDVWQMGMTLVEVMTQRLPVWDREGTGAPEIPAMPEPFREIAGHCLQVEAAKRWTVPEILARLERDPSGPGRPGSEKRESAQPAPIPAQTKTAQSRTRSEKSASAPANVRPQKTSAKWPYLVGLAALLTIAVVLIARPKSSSPSAEVQSAETQPGAAADTKASDTKVGAATPGAVGGGKAPANAEAANPDKDGVVQRVMPQISPGARRSIQGKIKVRVRVDADASGNVTGATLESAGPSRYFSRIALEAARDWKFAPAPAGDPSGPRQWKLQFGFSRAGVDASVVRGKR